MVRRVSEEMLEEALNHLQYLIDEEVEFPDAVWATTKVFPFVSSEQLQTMYDSQFERS